MENNQISPILALFAVIMVNILAFGSVFYLAKATNRVILKILVIVFGFTINILALIGMFNPAQSPIQGSIRINLEVIPYTELITLITYPVFSFIGVFGLTTMFQNRRHKIAIGILGLGVVIFSLTILGNPTGNITIR